MKGKNSVSKASTRTRSYELAMNTLKLGTRRQHLITTEETLRNTLLEQDGNRKNKQIV